VTAPLVKTYDGEHASKERDQAADDVMDLVMADIDGRTEVGDANRIDDAEDARAEKLFFEAVASKLGERTREWATRVRMSYNGEGTGYHFTANDRDGRVFQITVSYSELSEVAALQRNASKNLEHMTNSIADKLEHARRFYFERMRAATVGIG
jgi:hypothetical protein